jgi:hypothetical protein
MIEVAPAAVIRVSISISLELTFRVTWVLAGSPVPYRLCPTVTDPNAADDVMVELVSTRASTVRVVATLDPVVRMVVPSVVHDPTLACATVP